MNSVILQQSTVIMVTNNRTFQIIRWLIQYFLTFCALCAANHLFSVALFTICGYCLYTYTFVYTFLLVTFSLFLSNAVYSFLIRREEKHKVFEGLRAVSHEDIPRVMVSLINRSNERKAKDLCGHQNEVTPEGELCVACYENKPSIKNIPCGHSVLCRGCNWNLLRISIENRTPLICPWCRVGIENFYGEMKPDLNSIEWMDIKWALMELDMLKAKRRRSAGAL